MVWSDFTQFQFIILIIWIAVLVLLGIGLIVTFLFNKRNKNSYATGLSVLCIGFIVGRVFGIILKFDIGEPAMSSYDFNALIYLNIGFWTIIGIIFVLGAYFLFKDELKGLKFVLFWCALLIASVLAFWVVTRHIEASVGALPKTPPYEGTALLFENLFLTSTWIGFISLFRGVEKSFAKKTRYTLTSLTFITLLVTIFENYTGLVTSVLTILYMSSMIGMGLIFIYMAKVSEGVIRRHSLWVVIGHFCLALAFAFDVPAGKGILAFVPADLMLAAPALLHIVGLTFYYRGIFPLVFQDKSTSKNDKEK